MEKIYSYFEENQKHFIYFLVFVIAAAAVTIAVNLNNPFDKSQGFSPEYLIKGKYPAINIITGVELVFLSFVLNYSAFRIDNTILAKISFWVTSGLFLAFAQYFLSLGLGTIFSWLTFVILLSLFLLKSFHWFQRAVNAY